MTPAKHYLCSIEQADNKFDLEKKVNGGDANDLYVSGNSFRTLHRPTANGGTIATQASTLPTSPHQVL